MKLPRALPAFAVFSILSICNSVSSTPTEPTGKRWMDMNYGPYLTASVEAPGHGERNFAYKGVLVRVSGETTNAANNANNATMMFDTDLLRYAGAWTGGFLNMRNIAWDGSHGTHPKVNGTMTFSTPSKPGWANGDGGFDDPRELPYGPIPRDWAHWKGLYLHEDQVVLSYTVGDAKVLELPAFEKLDNGHSFLRHLQIDDATRELTVQVSDHGGTKLHLYSLDGKATESALASESVVVLGDATVKTPPNTEAPRDDSKSEITVIALTNAPKAARWSIDEKNGVRLSIPATKEGAAARVRTTLSYSRTSSLPKTLATLAMRKVGLPDLTALTKGGKTRWVEKLKTKGKIGAESKAFAIDEITPPFENPWNSWIRFGGFDFFPGGKRAAICTWMGDVWIVDGLDGDLEELTWQRIATGMFQPLGLKIVDETIYVLARDQITILRDLNGDGEADFYENFNNDAEVTEHFHEFAMDLQTDAAGNFYYMKGGRHAKDAVVPQHGTVIRVSKDGSKSRILAKGFRAPNGLCVNDDGTFFTSDQEGHWTPANRINWVEPGGFYGYNWSYFADGKKRDSYDPPVCWLHPRYDRSPAEQLWVDSQKWGALNGQLLSFSYGTGQVSVILHEKMKDVMQGGAYKLDIPMFPTGTMRGRFHKGDGHLYLCGLFGWAGNRTQSGGFYRVRHTGKPLCVPTALHSTKKGVILGFSEPVRADRAGNARSYSLERWNYLWRQNYGSKDYKLSDGKIGRDKVAIQSVKLSADRKWVLLEVDDMKPCMQLHIRFRLESESGERVSQEIYATINRLGPFEPHGYRFE